MKTLTSLKLQYKTNQTQLDPATPAEIIALGLDGWYPDFLYTIFTDAQRRIDDLDSLCEFATSTTQSVTCSPKSYS